MNDIMSRMAMVMNKDEMERMLVNESNTGLQIISLDLHQLDRDKAERLVKNVININRKTFTLRVIHGYNRGTVLMEMVRNDIKNKRIKERVSVP